MSFSHRLRHDELMVTVIEAEGFEQSGFLGTGSYHGFQSVGGAVQVDVLRAVSSIEGGQVKMAFGRHGAVALVVAVVGNEHEVERSRVHEFLQTCQRAMVACLHWL